MRLCRVGALQLIAVACGSTPPAAAPRTSAVDGVAVRALASDLEQIRVACAGAATAQAGIAITVDPSSAFPITQSWFDVTHHRGASTTKLRACLDRLLRDLDRPRADTGITCVLVVVPPGGDGLWLRPPPTPRTGAVQAVDGDTRCWNGEPRWAR